MIDKIDKSLKESIIVFTILIVGFLLASFVFSYVTIEHPAYIWDWGNFYIRYQDLGATATKNFQSALSLVLNSIKSEDYNVSSVSLLLPVYFLFGPQRVAYIGGIVILFLVPATFVTAYFCEVAYKYKISPISKISVFVFVVFFPPFWQAALRGLPDVVGLVPLGIASILLIKSEYLSRRVLSFSIAVGVLIWIAFMFRRWYAYAGVSLLFCSFLMALFQSWIKNRSLGKLLMSAVPFIIVFLVGVCLLMIFQMELLLRVIHTSYVDIYKAYQTSIYDHFVRYYSFSGPIFAILLVLGIFISIRNGYLAVLFFFGVGLLTIILFSMTQAPGIQHVLPVYFYFLPISTVPIFKFLSNSQRFCNQILFFIILVIVPTIYLTTFFPKIYQSFPVIANISPSRKYNHHPLYLANYSEYRRLISDIHQMLDKGDFFTVFASNHSLADSLLHALDRTLEPHILWASQVDQRDGFLLSALKARFAIIATPTPIHLAEDNQRVISVPSEMIRSGQGIGKEYRLVAGPYELANGHTAFVYERLVPLTTGAIRDLENAFIKFHKDWLWNGKDKISAP